MRGAIFDMDGLLIDSERLWQRTWHELAAERGVELGDGFAGDMCGTGGARTREVVARYYHTDDPEAVVRACSERMEKKILEGVPLKPGVHTILEGMRAEGWRVAVASSSPMDMVRGNLRRCGIDGYFDALVSGQEVAHGKPAPDVFLLAARRLDVPPADCFVFEDSLNGIEAGWRAGCRAVMVPDLVPPDEQARQRCLCVCRDLAEAWELVRI